MRSLFLNRIKKNICRSKGFTLSETLIVVGILVILMAVAVPNVVKAQKSLRQTELDAKAETIFQAVQNKLVNYYVLGETSKYDPDNYSDFYCINEYPGDYDQTSAGGSLNRNGVYFFTSESLAAEGILDHGDFDEELFNAHWVIEVVPYAYDENKTLLGSDKQITLPTVYAVYYSEEKVNVAEDYANGASISSEYLSSYRYRNMRLNDGARIGYFGGTGVSGSGSNTELEVISVNIHDEAEKMTAVARVSKPKSISVAAVTTLKLSDEDGHSFSVTYDDSKNLFYNTDGSLYTKGNIKVSKTGTIYIFEMTLDDLTKNETRFYYLYGDGSGHGKNNFTEGKDITLEVSVSCPDDRRVADAEAKSDTGNSLFAEGTADGTACIMNGRHLQNLNDSGNFSSHVGDAITEAVIINDIYFGTGSDWYEAYGTKYMNGTTTVTLISSSGDTYTKSLPNFVPIRNDNLRLLDGCSDGNKHTIFDLTVSDDDSAGLFSILGNTSITVKDIQLADVRISSKNGSAGAIAGSVAGSSEVYITGCQVFIYADSEDFPQGIEASSNLDAVRFITGNCAGGLAGFNTGHLNISGSSASMVLGNKTSGGLVGNNAGTVNIEGSYADSYIYGTRTGGLIGYSTGTVTLKDSYSAGFIGLETETSTGAGLVNGPVLSAESVYTIIAAYKEAADGGIDRDGGTKSTGTFFSTMPSWTEGNVKNVFYFLTGTNEATDNDSETYNNGIIGLMTSEELAAALDSDAFQINTNGTLPYKLMGQSLSTYTYPRLSSLNHYGDWTTEFMAGSLVYYEKYRAADGTIYYGFSGGGVDSSLSNSGTVLGDGYGIVLGEKESADSLTVSYGGVNYPIKSDAEAYTVTITKNGESTGYKIYPLTEFTGIDVPEHELINPGKAVDNFYIRIAVTRKVSSVDAENPITTVKNYFDYNPHFADTVKDLGTVNSTTASSIPLQISIRTPRQLYSLGEYYDYQNGSTYDGYYKQFGSSKVTFSQGRNLVYSEYEWQKFFDSNVTRVTSQEPIGKTSATGFKYTYNGNKYYIKDISFITQKAGYVGMFGLMSGTVKDVVILADYDASAEGTNYLVQRVKEIGANEYAYFGVLAGLNTGKIDGSAVAGYYLSGADGTIHGYANSHIYVGGLVGENAGSVTNSTADCPYTRVSVLRSTTNIGGLVGSNSGTVTNCYALNNIEAVAQGGSTNVGGFAGFNSGTISKCYCVTALTGSGDGIVTAAFTTASSGGNITDCQYLNNGSYSFVDGSQLLSYNFEATDSLGTGTSFSDLSAAASSRAVNSYNHNNTTSIVSTEKTYPFRAVLKDRSGALVHYGEWPVYPNFGAVGVFYWEHETGGENSGYHLTYIGQDALGNNVSGSTLCYSHDDGGVITEYGYGYYELNAGSVKSLTLKNAEINGQTTWVSKNASSSSSNSLYNTEASKALEKQVHYINASGMEETYTLYAFTTRPAAGYDYSVSSGYLRMPKNTSTTNVESDPSVAYSVWTLNYSNNGSSSQRSFYISPYFANAMSFAGGPSLTSQDSNVTDYSVIPGITSDNPYEVRSLDQLQFLNYRKDSAIVTDIATVRNQYYYIYSVNSSEYLYQSHDIDGGTDDKDNNFYPIGGSSRGFKAKYNGNSYQIKNLRMDVHTTNNSNGSGFFVGLFSELGTGCVLENIVLSAEDGYGYVKTDFHGNINREVSIGALVGLVWSVPLSGYGGNSITIRNCSAAGYELSYSGTISSSNNFNRYITIGGLVGNLEGGTLVNCSAANTIKVDFTDNSVLGTRQQLGGLVGTATATGQLVDTAYQPHIINCYAGGSISPDMTQESGETNLKQWIAGGLVGNAYGNWDNGDSGQGFVKMMTTNRDEGITTLTGEQYCVIENSYSYCEVPESVYYSDKYDYSRFNESAYNRNASSHLASITNASRTRYEYYAGLAGHYDGCTSISSYVINSYYMTREGRTVTSATTGTGLTYDQMADGTLLNYLNSETSVTENGGIKGTRPTVFHQVSSVDFANAEIPGKYSFPTHSSLSGKNYPFPSIITQKDITFSTTKTPAWVYVHYGDWPHNGSYWVSGTDSVDIFENLSEDGYAYKTYTLYSNGNIEGLDASGITIDNTEMAEVVSVTEISGTGNYDVRFRLKSKGTVTIYLTEDESVSFVLEITARLSAYASTNSVTLMSGESTDVTFSLFHDGTAIDSDKVTWTLTPGKTDYGDPKAGTEASGYAYQYKITGYGYDTDITVEASYNYNGINTFTAGTVILVKNHDILGMAVTASGVTQFSETDVPLSDSGVSGNDFSGVSLSSETAATRPVFSTDGLYMYSTAGSSLLDDPAATVSVTVSSSSFDTLKATDPEAQLTVISDDSAGRQTGSTDLEFKTRKLTIRYTTEAAAAPEKLTDISVTVTVNDGSNTYTFVFTGISADKYVPPVVIPDASGNDASGNDASGNDASGNDASGNTP